MTLRNRSQFRFAQYVFAACCVSVPMLSQTTAIPSPEIAVRSTELAGVLRSIDLRAKPDSSLARIRESLKLSSAETTELESYQKKTRLSADDLENTSILPVDWKPISLRLALWAEQCRKSASDLDRDRKSLTLAEKEWTLTLEAADFKELPSEVQERIQSNLAAIRSLQKTITERLSEVLILQSSIAQEKIRVDEQLDDEYLEENKQLLGLMRFDSQPIWRLSPGPNSRAPIPELKPETGLRGWAKEQAVLALARVGIFFVIFCLTLFGLRILKRSVSVMESEGDESFRVLSLVISRPWSAALFLAIMVCALIQSGVPSWLVRLAGFLLAIPSLRLLPGLIGSKLSRPVYGLVGLLIGLELVSDIPTHSVWSRVGWTVLQLVSIVFLIWLRQVLGNRATPGPWPASVRAITVIAMWFMIVATLMNVFGIFRFSRFVTSSVLLTCYGAAIVRGMTVMCMALLVFAYRSSFFDFVTDSQEKRDRFERKLTSTLELIGAVCFLILFLYITNLLAPLRSIADFSLKKELHLGSIGVTFYDVFTFLLTILLSFVVSRVLRLGMEAGIYRRLKMDIGQRDSFSKIVHYSVLLIGTLIAITAAGVPLSNIAVLAGGLSVGIGFGLQTVMNNFVSGLILLFERPIQMGDLINVGTTEGFVKGIGIRASVIRTFDGAEVIVPNGELLAGSLINWTQADKNRRVDIQVGAAYDSDPKQVMEILATLAKEHPLVLAEPEPAVIFSRFGDSALDFILRFWCHFSDSIMLSSDLRTRIAEAFEKANIVIPFPQCDVTLRNPELLSNGPKSKLNPAEATAKADPAA